MLLARLSPKFHASTLILDQSALTLRLLSCGAPKSLQHDLRKLLDLQPLELREKKKNSRGATKVPKCLECHVPYTVLSLGICVNFHYSITPRKYSAYYLYYRSEETTVQAAHILATYVPFSHLSYKGI